MKDIVRRTRGLCLSLLVAAVAAAAQERGATPAPAPEAPEGVQDVRRAQLRMLGESTLARAVEGITGMHEAALRISARNRLLTHLGEGREPSEADMALAARLAFDALDDFSQHGEEIPPSMADYLFNDLAAWIQKHLPANQKLVEALAAAEKNRRGGTESDRIRALLQTPDGGALAARHISQLLTEGRELNGISFYLDELRRSHPKEFEPLLAQFAEAAARGPQVSLETMFWVSEIFLRPGVSAPLRRRFLSAVVARTQSAGLAAELAPRAYELLNKVLPSIRELSPELYARAAAQSFNLRASLDKQQLAAEARNKLISESPDPFAELLAGAESARSAGERNELLAEAARLALERKRLPLCLEIVAKIDRAAAGPQGFWRNWADQFLKDFIKTALASKDPELAEKASAHVASPLARVEGLALLVRFWAKAGDRYAVRRLLNEAAKLADTAPDGAESAKAFLLLSLVGDAAEGTEKAGWVESAVKALNRIPRPDPEVTDRKPYQQYLRALDNTGYQLARGFGELSRGDEAAALSLSEKLEKPDLRTFALIGILRGLKQSLVAAK